MSFHFHRSTPRGEGAITLFELYGEGAGAAVARLVRTRGDRELSPGAAAVADLTDLAGGLLDEVVVARAEPHAMWSRLAAWTLTLHGSVWLERRCGEILTELGGRRLERDGVLRLAVERGSLDAVAAAAFAALVESETPAAARFFARQYDGELSRRLAAAASLARHDAAGALAEIETLLAGAPLTRRLRDPLDVQILGRANAGKSTLFNHLVEEERVAVTPLAGTTRDLIEERIAVAGFPVRLTDSAGLRLPGESALLEREAVERALARVREDEAVHVLYLLPATAGADERDRRALASMAPERTILVRTKTDLVAGTCVPADIPCASVVAICAEKDEGLERLRGAIADCWIAGGGGGLPGDAGEVPCAPFTETQTRLLGAAAAMLRAEPARVDAVRELLIECLRVSWPEPRTPSDRQSESSAHGVES